MDKRIVLSVAGAGKSSMIVNSIDVNKRYLILTYTDNNYENLIKKLCKLYGRIPDNVCVMTYFRFLYNFCYKPLLSDVYKAKGIIYESNQNKYAKSDNLDYYMTSSRAFYSNRFSLFLEKTNCITEIKNRLSRYYDIMIIDEVQDIAGRDFDFLSLIITAKMDFLFVGDFFQHTFSTSLDGKKNSGLYKNYDKYKNVFSNIGFRVEEDTLKKSWRCSPDLCKYVTDNLGISIESNREDHTFIKFVDDDCEIKRIWNDSTIVKLHYQDSAKYGTNHKNWGDTKGLDDYGDVCVLLNKTTYKEYVKGNLCALAESTKNKLYVALTRARGNVYLIREETALAID